MQSKNSHSKQIAKNDSMREELDNGAVTLRGRIVAAHTSRITLCIKYEDDEKMLVSEKRLKYHPL